MRKWCRENEWRNLRTHRVIGPKAAAAAFSHVVRNGAAGLRVVRATSSTAVPSNTRRLESGSLDSSASRVPSSRVVATTLKISRPTVNQAFSKLLEEGYLQVQKRSGIFVAGHLPATFLKAATPATTARTEHSPRVARRVTRMSDCRSGPTTRCRHGRSAVRHIRRGVAGSR